MQFITTLAVVGCVLAKRQSSPPVRGVILMISDGISLLIEGFGPASQTMARNYYQQINNLPVGSNLPLDEILVGSSRTRSSSSLVTDSAAGATAFACGMKTYNEAIGVDSEARPCATVLEAAKEKGYLTGLVATSRITHGISVFISATPASFGAHVPNRAAEDDIAKQMIGDYVLGRRIDLMFGGGYCHFLPKYVPDSCREDSLNIFEGAKSIGWTISDGMDAFNRMDKNTQYDSIY